MAAGTLHARLQRFAKNMNCVQNNSVLRVGPSRSYSKSWMKTDFAQGTSLHYFVIGIVRLVPIRALSNTNLSRVFQQWTSSASAFVPMCSCTRSKCRLVFQERNCFQKLMMTGFAPYSSKSFQFHGNSFHGNSALPLASGTKVIAFIETEEDFQLFLGQLQDALDVCEFFQTSALHVTNLAVLAQKLVALNCEPRNIAAMILANPSILKVQSAKLLQTIDFLQDLGLNWRRLMKVLDQNPSLWTVSVQQLQTRVAYLRKLGFVEGSLQKTVADWPEILTISTNKIKAVVQVLMDKCGFSRADMLMILGDSPAVIAEDLESIEVKFQYVFFRMGITDNSDMTQAKINKYSLNHIRCRHLVLERLGLYAAPDNRGRFSIKNPKLTRIVDSSDSRFAEKVAKISVKELHAFARTLLEEVRLQKLGGEAFELTEFNQVFSEDNNDNNSDENSTEDVLFDEESSLDETEEPFDFDKVDYRKKR